MSHTGTGVQTSPIPPRKMTVQQLDVLQTASRRRWRRSSSSSRAFDAAVAKLSLGVPFVAEAVVKKMKEAPDLVASISARENPWPSGLARGRVMPAGTWTWGRTATAGPSSTGR